ncbi:hypothetical protein PENTCL1PPCAC_27802, partial [Pristionchus entomophagus]
NSLSMGLSRLFLLLTFSCATFAWVPRKFDQDRSKTRKYGVLEKWGKNDPGIMMNPEMIHRPDQRMEVHQVPLFYDDDFAEPDGLYPKDTKEAHETLSFSVDGSAVPIKPRANSYNLYRRGIPPAGATLFARRLKLSNEQMRERYQWPRPMDRVNNRANAEYGPDLFQNATTKAPNPNDF